MAQASVKTIQYVDPRIEPQPDPVYDYVIGPTQNQFYQIPASGLSAYTINFNNLTTLGVDRAYLDTFEIELTAEIVFKAKNSAAPVVYNTHKSIVNPETIIFDSFPFNKCCEEARVNINGGAFFSQPMLYVRAKERYMNEQQLSKCYQNMCPIHKPYLQYESGRIYTTASDTNTSAPTIPTNQCIYSEAASEALLGATPACGDLTPANISNADVATLSTNVKTLVKMMHAANKIDKVPSRYPMARHNFMQSPADITGGTNNSIIQLGVPIPPGDANKAGYENFFVCKTANATNGWDINDVVLRVSWREPIFVSPFSSRYDATYGRPLYNITSMDLTFNLCDLGNMVRVANMYPNHRSTALAGNDARTSDYPYLDAIKVKITSAKLCYQVMTIPPIVNKPLTTLVPYRRFVPFITNQTETLAGSRVAQEGTPGGTAKLQSGVYTLNEIPTAIWVFCAPTKDIIQGNKPDSATQVNSDAYLSATYFGNFDSNKMFGYLEEINLSLANTTQILSTAKPHDLYRIAKANGCEDSFHQWYTSKNSLARASAPVLTQGLDSDAQSDYALDRNFTPVKGYEGVGSVLRLKPGVDIIVPDQPLIPGANANNMVFQVSGATYTLPHFSPNQNTYALWLLFEYVGVAAISPGQCEITMNPLGSGEIMAVSPIMSATSNQTEGELEGSGFWDGVKKAASIAGRVTDSGIISRLLKLIPHTEAAQKWAESHGFGEPRGKKRNTGGACAGGAVIGRGLNDWV